MSARLTGFSPIVQKQIQDRSEGICEICEAKPVHQRHHRRPRGAGGSRREDTNLAANCLGLCADCHSYVEINRADARRSGWLVPQHRNPIEIPVLRRGVWVLLDNRGDYIAIPEPAGGKVA